MALTDVQIRTAKPSEKPHKLSDSGGLYLEVSPSGGKWWRYKYRFDKKEKRLSLGTYPDTGLKEARAKHQDARRLLAEGIDPSEHRKAERSSREGSVANSFEVVAREWIASHMANKADSHKNKVTETFRALLISLDRQQAHF